MSVPAANNYPDVAASGAIATKYSKIVNFKYYAETLMPRITTTGQYSEILDFGDKVVIVNRGTTASFVYTKGGGITYTPPVETSTTLTMDRARGWAFPVNAIDAKQSHIVLSAERTDDGVKNMAIDIETDFFADVATKAATGNFGLTAGPKSHNYNLGVAGTPLAFSTSNALAVMIYLKAVLRENNTGQNEETWVVIPEVLMPILLLSDIKNVMMMGDAKSALRTGLIGAIGNQKVYVSNLFTSASDSGHTCWPIIAGNMDAIVFAAQLATTEVIDNPNDYGKLYRGLHVYDWCVRKPQGLVTAFVYAA